MKTKDLFPPIVPNRKFREQLKLEVLKVYNSQQQPRFNWRWLAAPGVALATLLLVIISGNGQPFSRLPQSEQLNRPELSQSDNSVQNTGESQQQDSGQQTQMTKTTDTLADLDQLEQELTELSNALDTDSELNAAIAFDNL